MKNDNNIIQKINNFYNSNLGYYQDLENQIASETVGRNCHHWVCVLNIIVRLYDVKTYLEIGVHNGTSMSYVVNQDENKIDCYGIDLFEQTIKQYLRDSLSRDNTLENIQKNNKSNSLLNLIAGNSFSKDTISKVSDLNIDLLFIDGDHSYKGISNDFFNYAPLVRKGGLIVIDDYNKRWPDVLRFVDNDISSNEYFKCGVFLDNEFILLKI